MKKLLVILLCLIIPLSGCGSAKTIDSDRLAVVTTIFPIYDFVRAVGGEKVDITLLIDAGTEVHSFDPTPSDIMAIQKADCFFYIGGESDEWVGTITDEVDITKRALIDCVTLICEDGDHSHSHDHSAHSDEHIWTSPYNAQLMIETIAEDLAECDTENADYYYQNAADYSAKIEQAANSIKEIVERAENPFLLVADRFPFIYFANAFDIPYKAAFGGCATSTDISLKTMTELVQTVEEKGLKCAFYTEMSSKNIAKALAEQTGVELYQLNSAHNVTLDEFKDGVTYLDLMLQNAEALRQGWGL